MPLPEDLQARLARPLPGVDAQLRVAHPARRLDVPAGVTPRAAGVLVLLYVGADGGWRFPLIERTSDHAADRHRGQIGLPGGKYEPSDGDLTVTALREAEEEVGVPQPDVRVLGRLTPLYIPVSNFRVTATVGFAERRPTYRRQPSEVARILEAPLAELLDEGGVRHRDVALDGRMTLKRVPYFDLAGEVVWGATAMMLSELRTVLREIGAAA